MTQIKIPEDLYYSKEHTWAKKEANGTVRIGITQYAADVLKDINQIQVKPVGSRLRRMTALGVVESIKAVSDIITPVSGVIKVINDKLVGEPWTINYDPYGDGWIVIIEPSNLEEFRMLLKAGDYEKLVEETPK